MQDRWTWDELLKYAELAAKENMTFGCGLGGGTINTNATDTRGALFKAFGAELIDIEGTIKLHSAEVHRVLEYARKLAKFYPQEAVAYDDASNNRALISGKSALIFNPPAAWAVAVRDNRLVGADCWTFSAPAGAEGALCAEPVLLLGRLVVQQKPDGSQGAAALPHGARAGGGAVQGRGRLRHPATSRHATMLACTIRCWRD